MPKRSRSTLSTALQPADRAGKVPGAEHQASAALANPNTGVLPPHKSLSQLHALESGSQIERWQESFASETTHEDEGVTTRLFRACLDSLTCILQHTDTKQISKREENILQRCQATLKLWGDGHGVWDGSLDHILDRSKNLQHMTLAILNPLCKTLSNGIKKHVTLSSNDASMVELYDRAAEIYAQTKWLLSGFHEYTTNNDSDSDSDSSSGDELEYAGMKSITEDVKTYTNCLVDLSAALECPAIDPMHEDEPSQLVVEQRSAQDYHSDLIRAKFPDAKAELVQCLGETSWSRYQRMQQQRDTVNAQASAQVNSQLQPQSGVKSHTADSEFQDSGLGTSLPSVAVPTSYAETVVSFMTSIAGGKRVQIPPLSAEAKNGAKFECVACGRHVRATTNRDWRKHLFLDLQPYTCFYANCAWSSQPFADRQLWSNHLELDHKFGPSWNGVECPLCLEVTESGKSAILIHFARHMEDISLAALPRDVDSDAESDDEGDSTSNRTASSVVPATSHTFYPCGTCISQLAKSRNFLKHLRRNHGILEDEEAVERCTARVSLWSMVVPEIESLFSDENLRTDHLLCAEMDRNGFVPIVFIFRERMRTVLKECMYLFDGGCPPSNVFEYRSDGGNHKIRQKSGWERWVKDLPSPSPVPDPLHLKDLLDKKAGEHDRELPLEYWSNPDYMHLPQSPPEHVENLNEQERPSLAQHDPRAKLYIKRSDDLVYIGRVRCEIDRGNSLLPERKITIRQEADSPDDIIFKYITKQQRFVRSLETLIGWTEPDGAYMELRFDEPRGCAHIWDEIQDICLAASEAKDKHDDSQTASRSTKVQESVVTPDANLGELPVDQSLWPTLGDYFPNVPVEQTDRHTVQLAPEEGFQHFCGDCNAVFDQRGDLLSHEIYHHSHPGPRLQSSGSSNEYDISASVHFGCSCGVNFENYVHFKRHEKTHDHKCTSDGCFKVFDTFGALVNHMTWECQTTRDQNMPYNPQGSPGVSTKWATDLNMTPQVLDFEQWAFKPDVSGTAKTLSTGSQPPSQPTSGRTENAVYIAPTASSFEPANQDQKSSQSSRKSKTACAECRTSHIKCNFGRPCANCVKRKLPTCTYEAITDHPELPAIDLKEYAYKPAAETSEADATRTRLQQTAHSQDPELYEEPSSIRVYESTASKDIPSILVTGARAGEDVPLPLPPPRHLDDLRSDHDVPPLSPPAQLSSEHFISRDSGYFDVEQSMRTRGWEASVGDGWVNIEHSSVSHGPQSPPRPSFWTNNDYGSGPSAPGDNDLLAEVQRLRQENEEKDTRLRQLEEAVNLMQKNREKAEDDYDSQVRNRLRRMS